eukprot:602492_1
MAEADYARKVVTIKCCIEPYASTIKKTQFTVKITSASNDDCLAKLIAKIRRKFKFLDNLDDSEWTMQIGADVVDKENGDKLQEILRRISATPVVQIVKPDQVMLTTFSELILGP